MITLFFRHVLGVRPECVSFRRGEARKRFAKWCSDGCAASNTDPGVFGPVLAARGEVEAQGRGSLHPHILVWLLALTLQEALDRLLRDPATFKQRVRKWMLAVVASVKSVQHTSVEQYSRWACAEAPERVSDDCLVPPLPFGPNEQRHMCADGGLETATAEETGGVPGSGNRPLFFYRPDVDGDEAWTEAQRPDLPLRNKKGEVVDKTQWAEEFAAEKKRILE